MKTIVNTAYINYCINQHCVSAASNSCRIQLFIKDCFVQGEVLCAPQCQRWKVHIVKKGSEKTVFSLGGKQNKVFCFEPDAEYEYRLVFTADKNCTLRLYNIPDCITDIMYTDNK